MSPIHKLEFAAALGRCLPLLSRPVIAVANSAGPDSTCLLFLLRQLFPPHALLSVHVHHHLQHASSHMAHTAAENAHILGIPHRVAHIPWGAPPFPPVPTTGSVERIARDARYNLLFHLISRARVSLLALGHHADDQLETAIMRLACGSTLLAAGMRPCRRWGMGSDYPLALFGYQGLNAFVVRPLLPFPKDRILATCHANHLHYINDPTNVQPHITPRNAIRHCLRDPPFSRPVTLPPTAPVSLIKIKNAVLLLQDIAPDVAGEKRRLHAAVVKLTAKTEYVDRKVTSHLTQHVLPSPIGTLLLSSTKLLGITDPDVRFALVLRVIRYASFHPWGSLRADADRRRSSIHRIVSALWASDPQKSQTKKFTAGGGVLWTPAIYNPNKSLRLGNQCLHATLHPGDHFCWLASRVPPFSKNPQQGAGSPTKLVIDLTERLKATIISDPLQVLYDCRFLLRIDPLQMPTHVKSSLDDTASIKVLPYTHYYWPKVVLQHESHPDQVLAVPNEDGIPQSWISIQWVRPLDAI
ncbi:PP-loop family-domain-containing protein [Boletus edulis BED1]|uniref:tRNA(Ile)-lysidine synthetase n=1 Tax=Boletus edulis BED1 TaxID=1328754 RepID=A0AAD4C3K4_BOLED|nr:PP-loop family-domain-containing protein [Boletus edulis BED1]